MLQSWFFVVNFHFGWSGEHLLSYLFFNYVGIVSVQRQKRRRLGGQLPSVLSIPRIFFKFAPSPLSSDNNRSNHSEVFLGKGVLRKRCSQNMQQIYSRTPMPKCDFSKVAKQLYWNHTSVWVISYKFAPYFQKTLFLRTPLGGCFYNNLVPFHLWWSELC